MSIPKEPRQMMINMMYLVLTALLAMNVSAEILNAFHTVNRGISNSNSSVDSKISGVLVAFNKEVEHDKIKAGPWKDKADQVHATTAELVKYIETLKDEIITASGGWKDRKGGEHKDGKGWTEEAGELSNHADIESTTRIFLENTKATPRAGELKKKIIDTRAKLIQILGPEDGKVLDASLPLKIDNPLPNEEGETKTWEEANFHMVPTIATVTLLNKFENDAKNSEGLIMETLIKKIGALDYKADKLAAKVIAPSSYVLEGQPYKADIFVAAYNSTQDPVVYEGALNVQPDKDGNFAPVEGTNPVVGGGRIVKAEGGMGKYDASASGEGMHTLSGAVMVKVAGVDKYYPFKTEWQSAKPAVVISPTKMNVFYIGVPNPVDISIPGVPSDKIVASLSQGNISGDPAKKGSYIATVTTQGEATVSVSAKFDNATKSMGSMKFRVKRIPDPEGQLGNLKRGRQPATSVRAQGYVLANLENFDFDARFKVLSFSLTYYKKRADPLSDISNSTALTPKMAGWLNNVKPGDNVYIDDIVALGPDGTKRKLPSVAYIVN